MLDPQHRKGREANSGACGEMFEPLKPVAWERSSDLRAWVACPQMCTDVHSVFTDGPSSRSVDTLCFCHRDP